jgi:transcriptional regulator with XRE-family HTH domain
MSQEHKHPLRAFRDANGLLSQEAAAALVGISQAMWSLLETGRKFASPRVARRIERLTGVSADSLMDFGDNEPETAPAGVPRKRR